MNSNHFSRNVVHAGLGPKSPAVNAGAYHREYVTEPLHRGADSGKWRRDQFNGDQISTLVGIVMEIDDSGLLVVRSGNNRNYTGVIEKIAAGPGKGLEKCYSGGHERDTKADNRKRPK